MDQKLCSIFPSIPPGTFYRIGQNYEVPKGKLYNAYNSFRSRMSQVGLILRRFQKNRSKPIEIGDEGNDNSENDSNLICCSDDPIPKIKMEELNLY